jgi:NitT/TauT family transport system substrate-binding protein/putative hydroxymethylpyrimidine transport system substrate-binding protein
VDAVVTFWNAEGVALRERGMRTREFRVDEFGAPRYPELVLATTAETLRSRPDLVRDTIAALAAGTERALADLPAAADRIADASDGDPGLVRAQLGAVAPALEPPLELDRAALTRWARFDARFGILQSPPDVEAAFPLLR